MSKIITFFLIILPFGCLAQFSISGRILNQADKQPIAGASVFLSNATNGGESADNGKFILHNVKNGNYTLVVSIIGYGLFSEPLQVNSSNIKVDDIYLSPQAIQLSEVNIKPDPNRELYLTMFKEQFLGKSGLAQDCKILNPDVLDLAFDAKTNTLTATSNDFLDIENDALGYKIKYHLDDFVWVNDQTSPRIKYKGNFLFEPLKGTPSQQRRWQRMRQQVYENSTMHFYRALLTGTLDEEGFKVQQYATYANPNRPTDSAIYAKIKYCEKLLDASHNISDSLYENDKKYRDSLSYWKREFKVSKILHTLYPYALEQREILNTTNVPGLYALGCDFDGLYVTYNKNRHFDDNAKLARIYNFYNTETTLISFNSPFAFIDANGIVADPYDISYTGAWSYQRMADLLPIDYEETQAGSEPADSTASKKVIAALAKYATTHIVEKAYLHFDKPYYAADDTMHFKAYLTMGPQHEPSILSGVLHVDLIGSDSKINRSINLEVTNGVAWGDLVLPDSLQKGNYRVRAYTRWMQNEGETGFFDKTISVGEVVPHKITTNNINRQPALKAKPDIQFFPEGGSLVTGIRSKVAFKAINTSGLGINVKGGVLDNNNKQVCTFSSAHLGMGYFYLDPEEGKTYTAKVTYPNGTQDVVNLPGADANGIVLAVNNDSTLKIAINICAGSSYYKANKDKDLTLIIYSGGTLTSIICKLDSTIVPVDMYKRALHSGIARITLFSPSGEPLSERLVFIQNYDQLNLALSSDKSSYATRGKVNIKLNAANSDGEPVTGHFSVSVTDENKVPVDNNNENTIINNLLLTSDLKGYVEQPNYYFTSSSPEALSNLDALMLTQGYRGFEWKKVLEDTTGSIAYQPENALELSGTVKTLTGKPVPDGHITLLSTKQNVVRDTTTDANGNFKFNDLYLTDTAKLVLHATMKNNNDHVKISINDPAYPPVTKIISADTSTNPITPKIAAEMEREYQQSGNMRTGILLKQVNIKDRGEHPWTTHLTHSINLNGPGQADQVIMGDDPRLVACTDLSLCLQGLLHGVRYGPGGITSIRTPIELHGATKNMVIILDGVLNDQSILKYIDPTDVYSIEVLESPMYLNIYGSAATGGAIVITTKRGDEYKNTSINADGSVNYTFYGFQKARTFYSPKYGAATPVNNHPDQRTTIYWQPELTTDESGNASFEFFNSDGAGTYRVVVEGIDDKGNLGRHVYTYQVQ